MKHNMTINELATTLQAQLKDKRDYIVPTSVLTLTPDGRAFLGANGGERILTDYCHRQVGSRLGIHASYYDKCRKDAPSLLADNVNHWLHTKPERRMIRTLGTSARAYLSDRFLPLDCFDLIEGTYPKMMQKGLTVIDAALTQNKMYLKAVLPREYKVKRGEIVHSGLIMKNSEVGDGAVIVNPFIRVVSCDNGVQIDDVGFRKFHVGRMNQFGLGDDDGRSGFIKPETYKATVRAMMLTIGDVIDAVLDGTIFDKAIEKINAATQMAIPVTSINEIVTEVTDRFRIGEGDQNGIMAHLIQSADMTKWGLIQSITRQAADVADIDESNRLETIGGQLLDFTDKQMTALWN